jgi:hypothetical protein
VWRNGHGLFVPLFMGLLARSTLRRDPGTAEESSAWGSRGWSRRWRSR